MRPIKFRGIDEEAGDWVFGYYFKDDVWANILVGNTPFKVNPETVGQSLERDDRQGIPIYEGDIRKITLPVGGFWGSTGAEKIGVIEWNDDTSMFVIRWGYSKNQHHCDDSEDIFYTSVLLGNIHDNPELIK